MARKTNDGIYLQEKLASILKAYKEYNPAFDHRFSDTKSARGNYIKSQPGDFMLLVPFGALLIECKSTVTGIGLLTLAHHGIVGKRQIAKHRLWQRAGHPSLYLYADLSKGKDKAVYEWHDGRYVIDKSYEPVLGGPLYDLSGSLKIVLHIIKTRYNPVREPYATR